MPESRTNPFMFHLPYVGLAPLLSKHPTFIITGILETATVKLTEGTGEQITCQSVQREHTKERSGLVFLVITLAVLSVFLMMFYLYLRTIQGGHQYLETI